MGASLTHVTLIVTVSVSVVVPSLVVMVSVAYGEAHALAAGVKTTVPSAACQFASVPDAKPMLADPEPEMPVPDTVSVPAVTESVPTMPVAESRSVADNAEAPANVCVPSSARVTVGVPLNVAPL